MAVAQANHVLSPASGRGHDERVIGILDKGDALLGHPNLDRQLHDLDKFPIVRGGRWT